MSDSFPAAIMNATASGAANVATMIRPRITPTCLLTKRINPLLEESLLCEQDENRAQRHDHACQQDKTRG